MYLQIQMFSILSQQIRTHQITIIITLSLSENNPLRYGRIFVDFTNNRLHKYKTNKKA